MVFMAKEVLLISTYMFFCYVYQWYGLSSNATHIPSITIQRWFVEATLTPYVCVATLIEYSVGCTRVELDHYGLHNISAIALKLPVFILMRIAESQSNFFLTRFELDLLRKLC